MAKKELKVTRSFRMYPSKVEAIAKRHGNLQEWFDSCVERELQKPTKPKQTASLKAKFKKLLDQI